MLYQHKDITFATFATKFHRILDQQKVDELRRLLEPLATYDPLTVILTPRPWRDPTPGKSYELDFKANNLLKSTTILV